MDTMKYCLLIVILCLNIKLAQADFDTASEAYNNKRYETAYNEFHRLAKIGNKRAQFNLGVMYLNGEFVTKDLYKAYAWGKLSEHADRPEFGQISSTLEKQFSPEELQQATAAFEQLKANFGDARIYTSLSPIKYQSPEQAKKSKTFDVNIIERKAPKFPEKAYHQGIQGWVTMGFDIYPDGSVRHPYVIESFPANVFDEATIDAVSKFKFAVNFKDGVEPHPVMATQTIEYQMKTRDSASVQNRIKQKFQERLAKLKSFAEQDAAQAQYVYAVAGSANLIPEDSRITAEEANQWLLKAAQNGHVQAQYHLGRNILRGKGCQVEKQKGIDWIVFAAEQGHPKSSRLAYRLLTKHEHLNNTDKAAEHWLKLAAENGDPEAQLDYAQHLVFDTDQPAQHTAEAKSWLQAYDKNRDKSVAYYLVKAQIHRLEKQPKQAEKAQKKAAKMAKKLGWEI